MRAFRAITMGLALAAGGSLTLSACVTGVDSETKAALQTTLESVKELTDLWQARLDALDGDDDDDDAGTGPPTPCTLCQQWTLADWGSKGGVHGWGTWAQYPDGYGGFVSLFTATIIEKNTPFVGRDYTFSVYGAEAGNLPPASGSAVWVGNVHAVNTAPDSDGLYSTADARLEADFGNSASLGTIDIDFTNFSRGQPDMSWDDVGLTSRHHRGGEFNAYNRGLEWIKGSFYGTDHDGVAGKFANADNSLEGVFGALRE